MDLKKLVKEILQEKKVKRDRCLRIADRKFDKPSAYKSGAVVRCRQGKIWKGIKETANPQSGKAAPYGSGYAKVKEVIQKMLNEDESLHKWFKRSGTPGKEGGWIVILVEMENVKHVVEKKAKNVLNIHPVVQHQHNVNNQVKVKNGEKQNDFFN